MITNILNHGMNSIYSYSSTASSAMSSSLQKIHTLKLMQTLSCGVVGFAAAYPVHLINGVIGLDLTEEEKRKGCEGGKAAALGLFVMLAILAPISEERVFRKYLPDTLLPQYYSLTNLQKAAVTSGMFGAIHFSNYLISKRTSKDLMRVIYQVAFCTAFLGPMTWIAKMKIGVVASTLLHMGFNFHATCRMIPKEKMRESLREVSPRDILPGLMAIALGIAFLTYQHQLFCRLNLFLFDKTIHPLISFASK